MASRIVGLAADKKEPWLVLLLKDPPQKIFIDSRDAFEVYGTFSQTHDGLKPMYAIEGETALFRLYLKRRDGQPPDVISWTAKVGTSTKDTDILLYELTRISTS